MWEVLKKDAKFVIIYLAAVGAAVLLLWILVGDPLATAFILLCTVLIYFLVFGEIFINEQYEEKHHGYVFLSTLPVNMKEIVAAKFLRVFLSAFFLVGLIVLLISLSARPSEVIVLARSFILLNGVIALLLAGLAFIGLFGMGYTLFLRISLIFLVFLQLIPFILMSTQKVDAVILGISEFLPTIAWLIVIPVALAVYFGLLLAAIKVKSLRPS
jgi:hypothetical protein